jgi:hypothetical protein
LASRILASILDLTSRATKSVRPTDFEIPIPVRLSQDFHSRRGLQNPQNTVPERFLVAKTPAPPTFCEEFLCEAAQNPVTGLWMGCTRLKINKIEARAFC